MTVPYGISKLGRLSYQCVRRFLSLVQIQSEAYENGSTGWAEADNGDREGNEAKPDLLSSAVIRSMTFVSVHIKIRCAASRSANMAVSSDPETVATDCWGENKVSTWIGMPADAHTEILSGSILGLL